MKRLQDKKWKSNPIHVLIPCRKCGKESAELYQLLEHGFIHTRCSICGADNPFSENEFIFLPSYTCPKCSKEMKPKLLKEDHPNACYHCEGCDSWIRLSDLLPDKDE